MRRILIEVAYDGTNYHGWQLQPGCETIESVLNRTLSDFFHEEIEVIGASRTDAGVHALGNIAVFDTNGSIPASKVAYALNSYLPENIVIRSSREVAYDFHPRKCNSRKTYEYRIYCDQFPNPLVKRNSFHVHWDLDAHLMQEAADYLVGEHDFRSFCCVKTQAESTIRTITEVSVKREEPYICIRVSGNGFLYNMVRIIAGTLIEVGSGKYPPDKVKTMLDEQNRCAAGFTAPPQGLCLLKYEFFEEKKGEVKEKNG